MSLDLMHGIHANRSLQRVKEILNISTHIEVKDLALEYLDRRPRTSLAVLVVFFDALTSFL